MLLQLRPMKRTMFAINSIEAVSGLHLKRTDEIVLRLDSPGDLTNTFACSAVNLHDNQEIIDSTMNTARSWDFPGCGVDVDWSPSPVVNSAGDGPTDAMPSGNLERPT